MKAYGFKGVPLQGRVWLWVQGSGLAESQLQQQSPKQSLTLKSPHQALAKHL